MNATTGGADCVEDYDAESNGRFCGAHSPNTNSRVLQTKAGNINTSNPDLYKQCALECIAKGYYGTAGIQTAYECWCSNFEGVQGYGVPSGQCNSKCADNVPCGGFCRMTLFSYTCPPAASAMTGGRCLLLQCRITASTDVRGPQASSSSLLSQAFLWCTWLSGLDST